MIVMDAHGMCRKGGGSGGDEVAHDIGGTMLRMYAKRVTRTDELDDPSLLEVPLPTPFGRYLVHAPPDDPAPPPEESQDVAWFGWDAAIDRADAGLKGALVRLRSVNGSADT